MASRARREPVRLAAPPPREFPPDIVPSTHPVVEHGRTVAAKASSDELARRIRTMLDGRDGVTEGTTFDALAWMASSPSMRTRSGEGELARWLDATAGYAAWLPPKQPAATGATEKR